METFTGSGLTFDEVVLGRRSARGFKRAPAPKALIRDVIEMAMRAPSSLNTQPLTVFVGFDDTADTTVAAASE
jgi:hypothetical protein